MDKIQRFKRTTHPKCIRGYQRVADKYHTCWRCPHPISPGDEYIGNVWVGKNEGRKYLHVSKEHEHCPGDRYEDDDEDENRRIQEEDAIMSEEKAVQAA